jgi:hypothetical protein
MRLKHMSDPQRALEARDRPPGPSAGTIALTAVVIILLSMVV